jgi:hypothetical protein
LPTPAPAVTERKIAEAEKEDSQYVRLRKARGDARLVARGFPGVQPGELRARTSNSSSVDSAIISAAITSAHKRDFRIPFSFISIAPSFLYGISASTTAYYTVSPIIGHFRLFFSPISVFDIL